MNKINILIIEDNEDDLFFIKKELSDKKYNIHHIDSGTEAYNYLLNPKIKPDIILLDNHLPGMSGLEILKALKDKKNEYCFIFLTIDRTIDVVVEAMNAGASDFIVKTANLKDSLNNKIDKVIEIYNANIDKLASEANFISIIESGEDKIWAIDKNYCLTAFNQNFKTSVFNTFNVKIKLGDNVFKVLPKEVPKFWQPKYDKTLTGEKVVFEFSQVNDFLIQCSEIRFNPIIIDDIVVGVSAISTDITSRKLAENAIRESNDFKETLLKTTPDIIYICDIIEQKNVYTSDGIMRILGYTIEEIQEFGESLTTKLIHPDDFNTYLNDIVPRYNTVLDGELIERDYRMKHKNGNWCCLHSQESIFKRDGNGNPVQVFGIATDVTQKKKIQKELHKKNQLLKSHIDNTPLGAIYMDNHSIVKEWNLAAENIFGYTAKEAIGKNIIDLVTPKDKIAETKVLCNSIFSNTGGLESFNQNITKQGEIIYCNWYNTLITDANNQPVGSASLVCDITVQYNLENTIKQIEKNSAFKVLEDYYNTLAKGLNQILNADYIIIGTYNEKGLEKTTFSYLKKQTILPNKTYDLINTPCEIVSKKGYYFCPENVSKIFNKDSFLKEHNIKGYIGIAIYNSKRQIIGQLIALFCKPITEESHIKTLLNIFSDKVGIEIERNKMLEKILENEKNLLKAQEVASLGFYTLNIKNDTWTSSAILDDIFGINKSFVRDINGWINIVHPEDRKDMMNYLKNNILKNHEKFNKEYRIIKVNNKKECWVHGLGELEFDNDDNPIKMIGTIQDITLEKQSELDLQKAYSEVERLKNQLEEENISLKKEIALAFNYEDMVYSSIEISNVLTQVEQVATTDATVLILGETGTGKELIASAIHNTSERKNNSLIRVNCAAIPSELIESELFGHIKGSFTGAINNRIGKFELANGGTLFLDELGELPLALQPKLLRAIQEGEISPIGSSEIRKLDVRIIAATNKDLKKEVEQKLFREDLYFRLNVFPITIPPLRERIEDIPVLINHFVNKYCKKYRKEIKYIADNTLQEMKAYAWPGNVRELENIIERSVIISNQELLIIKEFDKENSKNKKIISNYNNTTLEEVQHNHIIKILNETHWKIDGKQGAAMLLNIKPSTLRDRMKKFGIIRPKA